MISWTWFFRCSGSSILFLRKKSGIKKVNKVRKISIAVPEANWMYFEDIAKAVYRCCIEAGLSEEEVELAKFRTLDNYNRGEVNFIFGAHIFAMPDKEGNAPVINKPEGAVWVWYQLEQLPYVDQTSQENVIRWHSMMKIMGLFDKIIVESPAKKEFLKENKVESSIISCGYHEQYEVTTPKIEVAEPQWDVFFYGLITPRRRDIIEEILNRKIKLYPFASVFLTGSDRLFAMRNSKVVLNVHMSQVQYFEKPRIICDSLSNGAFVLTEDLRHPEGFVSQKHFMSAPYDHLVEALVEILEAEDGLRESIAEGGQEFVKTQYTLFPEVREFLKEVNLVG